MIATELTNPFYNEISEILKVSEKQTPLFIMSTQGAFVNW